MAAAVALTTSTLSSITTYRKAYVIPIPVYSVSFDHYHEARNCIPNITVVIAVTVLCCVGLLET